MTITIPSGRTLPLQAKVGGGFASTAINLGGGGSGSGSGISVSYTGTSIGETLTISTSTLDFTAKTNAAPLWYIDPGAEGVVDASPLSRLSVGLSGRALGNLDTTTKKGPNGAAVATLVGSSPDWRVGSGSLGPSQGSINTSVNGAGDHLRIITRWRRNFNAADAYAKWQELNPSSNDWNIKRWRWWATNNPTFQNNMVFAYGQSTATHGNPRITPEGSLSGSEYQTGADKDLYGMKKDQWVSEVIEIRQSSVAGANDGLVRHIGNGQEFVYQNVVTYDDDGNDSKYVELVMEQWQYIYTDVPFSLWHDHIYVDDTPHAVIVTDRPNWGDITAEIDPLIPTAWSPTEITAKARCDIAGRYLYVIDGSGTVLNPSGVQI